jgi:hypothetical protein
MRSLVRVVCGRGCQVADGVEGGPIREARALSKGGAYYGTLAPKPPRIPEGTGSLVGRKSPKMLESTVPADASVPAAATMGGTSIAAASGPTPRTA